MENALINNIVDYPSNYQILHVNCKLLDAMEISTMYVRTYVLVPVN